MQVRLLLFLYIDNNSKKFNSGDYANEITPRPNDCYNIKHNDYLLLCSQLLSAGHC